MCVNSLDSDRACSRWGILLEHLWFVEAKSPTLPHSKNNRSLNSLRCWALRDVQWSINPVRKSESISACPGALSFICFCGLTETDMNMKSVQIKFILPHMKETVSSRCFLQLYILTTSHLHSRNGSLRQITHRKHSWHPFRAVHRTG